MSSSNYVFKCIWKGDMMAVLTPYQCQTLVTFWQTKSCLKTLHVERPRHDQTIHVQPGREVKLRICWCFLPEIMIFCSSLFPLKFSESYILQELLVFFVLFVLKNSLNAKCFLNKLTDFYQKSMEIQEIHRNPWKSHRNPRVFFFFTPPKALSPPGQQQFRGNLGLFVGVID